MSQELKIYLFHTVQPDCRVLPSDAVLHGDWSDV